MGHAMTTPGILRVLAGTLLASALVAGIGSPFAQAADEPVAAAPAPKKKAAKKERPAVDGAAVYRTTCNRCHNARTLEELDPARWELAVTHMRVRGSLPQRDVDALLLWMSPPEDAGVDREAEARGVFPDLPLVAERCVRCHGINRVQDAVAAGQDATWWAATLARMRAYGAKLTPNEEATLGAGLEARATRPQE